VDPKLFNGWNETLAIRLTHFDWEWKTLVVINLPIANEYLVVAEEWLHPGIAGIID
jgi:hypothetical protein